MCSIETDIEDFSDCSRRSSNRTVERTLDKCRKCNEKPVVLLQKKDPFCKQCFLEYCNHKFRSTIGKAKQVKHGDKVLLACSGGRKSSALLHLTQKALKSAHGKQISFAPGILFINENIISPIMNVNLESEVLTVINQLKSYNFPVLYSSLEMVDRINTDQKLYCSVDNCSNFEITCTSMEDCNLFKKSVENMNLSAKVDLIKHLRLLLMTEIASCAGYKYLFVGDSATSLAVELLSDIALGRGSQIAADTSFCNTRYKVPVCRPLREFLNKEIALYNHLNINLHYMLPDLLTKTSVNSSVQRLTETFINNLQENFPATIFTVFRTGSKLSRSSVMLNEEICVVCKSKLDNIHSESCSALEALRLSEKLSTSVSSSEAPKPSECETVSMDQFSLDSWKNSLTQFLCHGCSVTFQQVTRQHIFQSLLPKTECVKIERFQLKEQIKDFLLENSDDCS